MKKKLASKVLAGALASAMIFSMAACGNNDNNPSGSNTPPSGSGTPSNTSAPSNTQAPAQATPKPAPMKFTMAIPADEEHLEANPEYDQLVKEINEYVNMEIDWQWQASATYYDQLLERIKAGNVADVIVGPTRVDVGDSVAPTALEAAKQGLFWDLAPYYKDYDNLAAIPDAMMKSVSDNGAIYFLPRSRNLGRYGFGYRQDWAEKLNLKISDPMTWQEFHDMLYAFTYQDPDGNGLNDTVGLLIDQWHGAFEIMFSWFNVPTQWGLDDKGNLIHYSQTKEYKTALKAIRELYAEGLINDGSHEGIPVYTDIVGGKIRSPYIAAGKGGVYIQCLDDVRKSETGGDGLQSQGFGSAEKPAMRLESFVDTGAGIHVCPNGGGYNGTIMISTVNIKTEDQLRRVLQCLNDLNDGKMIELMDYGWEGKTYSIDENGYVHRFDPEELSAAGVATGKYSNGFNQCRTQITASANAQTLVDAPKTQAIEIRENELYEWNLAYCIPNYGAGYTPASLSGEASVADALNSIISEAETKYIKGEIDENGLDDAIGRWLAGGGTQVTQEINDLYHAAGN